MAEVERLEARLKTAVKLLSVVGPACLEFAQMHDKMLPGGSQEVLQLGRRLYDDCAALNPPAKELK